MVPNLSPWSCWWVPSPSPAYKKVVYQLRYTTLNRFMVTHQSTGNFYAFGLLSVVQWTVSVIVAAAVLVIDIFVDTFTGLCAGIPVIIFVVWAGHIVFSFRGDVLWINVIFSAWFRRTGSNGRYHPVRAFWRDIRRRCRQTNHLTWRIWEWSVWCSYGD